MINLQTISFEMSHCVGAYRPKIAAEIPAAGIVCQLPSGTWTDLNKTGFLLSVITMNGDIALPKELREEQVVDRLIEMARWRTGHAKAAQYILGSIGGIDKRKLEELINAGKVEMLGLEQRCLTKLPPLHSKRP
jgi:hypothetical protein